MNCVRRARMKLRLGYERELMIWGSATIRILDVREGSGCERGSGQIGLRWGLLRTESSVDWGVGQ